MERGSKMEHAEDERETETDRREVDQWSSVNEWLCWILDG